MPGATVSAEDAARIPNLQAKLKARIFYIPGTEPQSLKAAVPGKGHRSLEPRRKAAANPEAPAEPPKAGAPSKKKAKKGLFGKSKTAEE